MFGGGVYGGALGVWRSGFRSWRLSLADAGAAPHGNWRLDNVQPFHGPFGCADMYATACGRRCGEFRRLVITQAVSAALCNMVILMCMLRCFGVTAFVLAQPVETPAHAQAPR